MLFSLLLAFSLSLDALGIGLSYGLRSIRFRPSALLLLTIEAFLMMGRACDPRASHTEGHGAQFIKNSSKCCICNFYKAGKVW